MSLTVTEANAVNRLVDYLITIEERGDPEVEAAIQTLIAGANKRLSAGARPEEAPTITRRIADRLQAADSDGAAQAVCRGLATHTSHGGTIPWPLISGPYGDWKEVADRG